MKRTSFFAVVVWLGASVGLAQEPLTLADAVARALVANPAVRAAAAGANEAGARLDQARAGFLPRVSLVESWQRGNQPVFVFSSLLSQRRFTEAGFAIDTLNHPDPLNNFRAAIAVEQPIFDGTRTRAGVRAAALGVSLAGLARRTLAADLALATTQAYGQALRAQAEREAARSALASAAEDLRRTGQRRDAGFETDANVLALEVQHAEMRARLIRTEGDARVAFVELNHVMGADLDLVWRLAPPAPAGPDTLDAGALETQALDARPELARAVAERDLALATRDLARSALLPQVGLQAAVEMNGDRFTDRSSAWVVGTEISWTLFAGGANRARVREAEFAATRAAAERERVDAAVRADVRSAIARLEAARASESVGRKAADQARESQRIIRARYDAGMAPASELLRANTARLDAETLRTSTLVDLVVSAAVLDRAVGR